MDRLTREQLHAEFGEPGVENPAILDLVTVDARSGAVVLVMKERRAWGASGLQFRQIEEKINRYLGYALDGFLVEHYPQYAGKAVQIRLDCVQEPFGEAARFIAAARQAVSAHGLGFEIVVSPASAPTPSAS